MRWIIFLFSLPNIVWAFQSSLSASYSDSESSDSTIHAASYKYYTNDISYGGAPFTELAFLTSTSTLEIIHGTVDYNFSNTSLIIAEGSFTGVRANLYPGDLYFSVSSSKIDVDTDTLFDLDSSVIDLSIGFRILETNMLYGMYSLQSIDSVTGSTDVIETGIGLKSVISNIVFDLQSTSITEDQVPDIQVTEITLANYLDNDFFISLNYEDRDSQSLTDQREEKGFSIGAAVQKSNTFNLSYIEVTNALNQKSNDIRFTMSFGF